MKNQSIVLIGNTFICEETVDWINVVRCLTEETNV